MLEKVRKAGWPAMIIGLLDWFARYQLVRGYLTASVGSRIASILSISWLSPVILIVGFIMLILLRRKPPNPDLAFTPSSGPSDTMLLAVKNKGRKQKFYAQCRPLARRNDPNVLRRTTYDLRWENDESREAVIATGESRNLLIATAEIDRVKHFEEVRLIERTTISNKYAEWSRWDRGTQKPEYDLEISVFGEGNGEHKTERFTLKCDGASSALEMTAMPKAT